MAGAIDPALVPDGTPHRLTFDEFVRLGELGIYPQQSELVDGIVFDSSSKDDSHYRTQRELLRQLVAHDLEGDRYDAGPEPTLKLDDANGPMPDILVTYANQQISNATTALIVEIADSSLAYDRETKRDRDAEAGIGEYWIVDLRQERVERYLPASAAEPTVIRPGDALALAAFPDVTIDIRRLFAKATSLAEGQR